MKRLKIWMLALLLVCCVPLLTACDGETQAASSSGNQEQNHTESNQETLLKAQPPVSLNWSLERDNINRRTKLWNDPNKIGYIYLIEYGKVMAFYTIKGKVTSVNSQITNSEQLTWKCVNADGSYNDDSYCNEMGAEKVEGSIPSPAEDGSYGTNGNSIYFFTTDGVYVEWQGDYMLSDQPLTMATQPELIRTIK